MRKARTWQRALIIPLIIGLVIGISILIAIAYWQRARCECFPLLSPPCTQGCFR